MHDISTNFYKNLRKKSQINTHLFIIIIVIDEKQSEIIKGRLTLFHDYSWASIFMEFVKLHFKDTLWTMFLHVTIKNIVRILTLMNI